MTVTGLRDSFPYSYALPFFIFYFLLNSGIFRGCSVDVNRIDDHDVKKSRFIVSDAGKGHAWTAPSNDLAASTRLEVFEQVQGTVALVGMIRLQNGMTMLSSQRGAGGRFVSATR